MYNYIEEANVTMSGNFHEGVPAMLIAAGLSKISEEINSLDSIKKFLFYGREHEGLKQACSMSKILHPNDHSDVNFELLLPGYSRDDAIRVFHGIIGIITEAGELAHALSKAIILEQPLDTVNIKEEIGDSFWYDAAILRVLGTTFEEVQRTNIEKLRARYPNKFTEFDANNRNLDKERAILETKPLDTLFDEEEAKKS